MTARICSKCRFWKRGGADMSVGVCLPQTMHTGASDTCAEWEARK